MTATNPSALWGRIIVDELAAQGIAQIAIAPGSRSTPLVLAAVDHPEVSTYSILDERSAGYFAVGQGKTTGEPSAVISTSGTAAVNFHPAVVEADVSRTPIVVCTADRPAERHDIGANQTINQHGLYGNAVRAAPVLPEPSTDIADQDALRHRIGNAVRHSTFPVPGPVHLNIPLKKPLEPDAGASAVAELERESDVVTHHPGHRSPSTADVAFLADLLDAASRPLLVAGADDRAIPAALHRWACDLEVPMVADPLSGARFSQRNDENSVLGGYDAWLDPGVRNTLQVPDLVIRVGPRPTSTTLQAFLAGAGATDVIIDPYGAYRDPTRTANAIISAEPEALVEQLQTSDINTTWDASWVKSLTELEHKYWEVIADRSLPAEGRIAHELFATVPPSSAVFVSNSMPVRDVDRFAKPRAIDIRVIGNRGASGVDGITSTALGMASTHSTGPAVLLSGDLAFYHDMTGILTAVREDIPLTWVVVNNDGGGIFNMLPIQAWDPPFTEHFVTPHGLGFQAVAELYDIEYHDPEVDRFSQIFQQVVDRPHPVIIEVEIDGTANHHVREQLQQELQEAISEP